MRDHMRSSERPERYSASSRNAQVGDQGELWFAAQLPLGWVWQPPRRDLGKDGLIVIQDGSDLHNLEFSVQVKTSKQPRVKKGWVVKSGLSRSSVLYWFASPLPTLVVAVDIVAQRAWYAWHLDLFESPAEVVQSKQHTVTIRIPQENELTEPAWERIRRRLRHHFESLHIAIGEAKVSARLLPTVNTLARNLGNLLKLSKSPLPANAASMSDQEGVSILIEHLEHRSIICSVERLLSAIHPESPAARHIRVWIETYEATVLEAFPRFHLLPETGPYGPELELAFAPKKVLGTRHRLIEAGLDMIRLLTADTSGRVSDSKPIDSSPTSEPNSSHQFGERLTIKLSTIGEVSLARVSVAQLGFLEGATTKEIIGAERDADKDGQSAPFSNGRARQLGLDLCPPDVGPELRLSYGDQPLDERLYIAMRPISTPDGEPRVFVLEHKVDGLSLDAARARPDDMWNPADVFVFCLRS